MLRSLLRKGLLLLKTEIYKSIRRSSTHTARLEWKDLSDSEQAKLSAFSQRLGVDFENKSRLVQALSHRSFAKEIDGLHSSERLEILGSSVLKMFVTEYVFAKYPKLPAAALDSAVDGLSSIGTLSDLAQIFGVANVMRWTPVATETGKTGEQTVAARTVQALIGAIYIEKGAIAARDFIDAHVLSRKINMAAHLNMASPKHTLLEITNKLGRKRPVARLLKETGAASAKPVFLVGMYSGVDKIGEGYGDSKEMAEERAARDALKRYYLKEASEIVLQSDSLTPISFFE